MSRYKTISDTEQMQFCESIVSRAAAVRQSPLQIFMRAGISSATWYLWRRGAVGTAEKSQRAILAALEIVEREFKERHAAMTTAERCEEHAANVVADMVRDLLRKHDMTHADLATELGVSGANISALLGRKNVKLQTIVRVLAAFGYVLDVSSRPMSEKPDAHLSENTD